MSIFRRLDHGRAKVGPAGDVDGRLTPGQSAIVIVVLSVLSWAVLISIVLALRHVHPF